ncbi:LysR family transcriptional regulator [Marinomonas sp. PE14-40]|uniref:LysR family transcriptional regulator n=1 Tax=Marinomonas sp. PE14-40 TaxID=3060621 RepID=UPI003F67C5E2
MNTSDLTLFVQIAQSGSITASAKQAGITTAAASSALKRLEQQLGVQLFIRSTRQLRITLAGEKFLFHCQQALASLELGVVNANESVGSIAGNLRLSVSSDLGRNILMPWIDEILGKHPALAIDLTVSDTLSNFFEDKVELALRYGKPQDSNLVAFHIASLKRITCASPDYLATYGEPKHPEELRDHACLLYRINDRLFDHWEYSQSASNYKVKVSGNRVCNDTDIVKRWALAGHGIAYRSEIDIYTDIKQGRLIQILTEYQAPVVELYLVCPSRQQVTPTVIAFRELLREKIKQLV